MEVDCVVLPRIVVEYDGEYFHRSDESVSRDCEKTLNLLSSGYQVVRIRETVKNRILPDLPLDLVGLTQRSVVYDTDGTNLRIVLEDLIKEGIFDE